MTTASFDASLSRAVDVPSLITARLRMVTWALGVTGVVLGLTGITTGIAFSQASTLKWALTVLGPLYLVFVSRAREPLVWCAGVAVLVAPLSSYVISLGGTSVAPTLPFVFAGALLAICTERAGASRTRFAVAFFLCCLIVPLIAGLDTGPVLEVLFTLVTTAWVVARAARRPGGQVALATALVLAAGLEAAIAVWEFRTGHLLSLYSSQAGGGDFSAHYFFSYGDGYRRPPGTFSDPISLGNFLAVCIPLGAAVTLAWWRRRQYAAVAAVALCTIAATFALALTLSRLSWIGAAVGCALFVVLLPAGLRGRAASGLAAAVVAVVAAALTFGGPALTARFGSIADPTASTVATAGGDQTREEIWSAALHVGTSHPVFGVGFGRLVPYLAGRVADVGPATHAHSTYFEVFAVAGLVGVAGLAVLILALFADLSHGVRSSIVVMGLAGALVTLLVSWTTDFTIQYAATGAALAPLFGLVTAAGAAPYDAEFDA